MLGKLTAEMREIFESDTEGNLGNVHPGVRQQLFGSMKPKQFKIPGNGLVADGFKLSVQLGVANCQLPAEVIYVEIFVSKILFEN